MSHADEQKAGIFLVRLHKSIYLTVFCFLLKSLFSNLATKMRSKWHWRKWGTALRRSSPKWRRKWDGLKHFQPCQDIRLTVYPRLLCGHLFDVFSPLCSHSSLFTVRMMWFLCVFLVVGPSCWLFRRAREPSVLAGSIGARVVDTRNPADPLMLSEGL